MNSAFGVDHGFSKAIPEGLPAKLRHVQAMPRSDRTHQLERSLIMRSGDGRNIHGPKGKWVDNGSKRTSWDAGQRRKIKTYNARLDGGLSATPPKQARKP